MISHLNFFINFFFNFRWNKSPIESLPQCMKVVFDTVVELGEEIELATTESGKSSFVVQYFKQAV